MSGSGGGSPTEGVAGSSSLEAAVQKRLQAASSEMWGGEERFRAPEGRRFQGALVRRRFRACSFSTVSPSRRREKLSPAGSMGDSPIVVREAPHQDVERSALLGQLRSVVAPLAGGVDGAPRRSAARKKRTRGETAVGPQKAERAPPKALVVRTRGDAR